MLTGMVLSRGLAVRAALAVTLAGAAAAAQSLSSVPGFVSDDTGAAFRVGDVDQQEVFLDDGVTPNPEFGLAGAVVGARRQAQLALRILF